jgi:predicted DNA-binding transcriptional regulator AlpA
LPAVRVGPRRVRVRQSDLDEFLNLGAERRAEEQGLQPASEEELLSRSALANRLQRSAAWVDAQVRDGMPYEQPSGGHTHRRFRLSEVKAWLEQRGEAQLIPEGKVADAMDLEEFANVLTEAATASQDRDTSKLADALRAVSNAAERLADALERDPGSVPS